MLAFIDYNYVVIAVFIEEWRKKLMEVMLNDNIVAVIVGR